MSPLVALLGASARIDFEARARMSPGPSPVPVAITPAPDLRAYDHLLVGGAGVRDREVEDRSVHETPEENAVS